MGTDGGVGFIAGKAGTEMCAGDGGVVVTRVVAVGADVGTGGAGRGAGSRGGVSVETPGGTSDASGGMSLLSGRSAQFGMKLSSECD
eukprot:4068411-Pleurochrysis_carterae.AAC.1